MNISYEELYELVQDAIDEKYPPILPAGSSFSDVPDWANRYHIQNLWDDKVFVHASCSFSDDTDPEYGLMSVAVDEGTIDEDGDIAVTLGDLVPMKAVARAIDGSLEIEIDLESAQWAEEAAKRNSKNDASVLNDAVRKLVGLLNREDLDPETVDAINRLVVAPVSGGTAEGWDGSKSRFSVDQLMKSVPRAMARWAKTNAKKENRPVTKDDLHLPYKDPGGGVNLDGVRNALSRAPQVNGVPSEVIAAATAELQRALKGGKKKESVETQTEAWDGLSGEILTETFENVVQGQFDKANLIIRGHKVLGVESKNNRRYPVETQKAALPIFEGAKAYLNHPTTKMMGEARDVRDLIGEHKNVRVEGNATYSDLHLLDNPTVRDYVVPVAEKASHLIGSSIVVKAIMKKAESDGIPEAQQIVACRSIDLVAEPATTNGLYESVSVTTGKEAHTEQENTMELKDLTIEMLRKERSDLVELVLTDTAKQKEAEDLKAKLATTEEALKATQEKVVVLEAKELKLQRETEIDGLVREAKVPDELKYEEKDGKKTIKSHIQGMLDRCANTTERNTFIADWEGMAKGLVKPKVEGEKPTSTIQNPVANGFAEVTSESFLKFASAIGN